MTRSEWRVKRSEIPSAPPRRSHFSLLCSHSSFWVVLALSVLLVPALGPEKVEAHANYAESDPAANSVVEESPERVTVRFTEPLEPALSEVQVFDSRGDRVDSQDSAVDLVGPAADVGVGGSHWSTARTRWPGRTFPPWTVIRVRGAFVFSVGEPISDGRCCGSRRPAACCSPRLEPVSSGGWCCWAD